jgi:hypothetical protein
VGDVAVGLDRAGAQAMIGFTLRRETSWLDKPGGPAPFYRKLGFVPVGDAGSKVQATLLLN